MGPMTSEAIRTQIILVSSLMTASVFNGLCSEASHSSKSPASTARTPKAVAPPASPATKDEKKPKTIAETVKFSKKYDGLFTLYQDTTNGTVHLLIRKNQLG